MIGYLRMLASEFDAWNTQATIIAKANGMDCNPYTYSRPDMDGIHVHARIEHDLNIWARLMNKVDPNVSSEHDLIVGDVKTEAEAIADGMVEVIEG